MQLGMALRGLVLRQLNGCESHLEYRVSGIEEHTAGYRTAVESRVQPAMCRLKKGRTLETTAANRLTYWITLEVVNVARRCYS